MNPLAYEDSGSDSGETLAPVVFLHGIAGNGSLFRAQVEYFHNKHRVLTVDLPGHGASVPPAKLTLRAYCDALLELFEQLSLKRPVLVGHSFGAIVALELAQATKQTPFGPACLILLDAPILLSTAAQEAMGPLFGALHGPRYGDALNKLADSIFFSPYDTPAHVESIRRGLQEFDRSRFLALTDLIAGYDAAPALAGWDRPLLYVQGVVPLDLQRLCALCPQVVIGKTVGAGHFMQVEVPEQVNAMIERFLNRVGGVK